MKVLIDTHALLWFLEGNQKKLSTTALNSIISDANEKYVSIASLWEIAIKVNIGKLQLLADFSRLENLIASNGFQIVAIEYHHLIEYEKMEIHHRDPFDRILVAQSAREGFQIITADPNLSFYKIKTIW